MTLPSSLQRVAHGAVDLLHTRLSLLSVEAQALFVVAAQALACAALAGLLLLVALGCAVAALVVAAPPEHRAAVLAGLTLLLTLAAWALLRTARQQWRSIGPPFAASLDELARDRAALQPREPAA